MRRPRIIILIAVIAVFILLSGATIFIYRQFIPPAGPDLPDVPTLAYSTSTPGGVFGETTAPEYLTPAPTPTAGLSFFVWPSFNSPQYTYPTNTPVPYKSPTSIQPTSVQPTSTIHPTSVSEIKTCRNILYPVVPGQEWNYQVNANTRSGDVSMNVVSVIGSQGIVDVINHSRGLNGRTFVQCEGDTIINFPGLNAELLVGSALNGTMKADYVSGILAPNEAAFVGSNWALSWSSQYLTSGSGVINYGGKTYNLTLNPSYMTMTCQTLASGDAAFETVSVTAGTYRALKVICLGQGQAAGTVNGIPIVGWVSAQSTQWFAPYIGMVKLQSDFVNLDFFGITIPLNVAGVNGQVELQSVFQGP